MATKQVTLNLNIGERSVLLGICLNQGGDHVLMAKVAKVKAAIKAPQMTRNPTAEKLQEGNANLTACVFEQENFEWFAELADTYGGYSGQFAEWTTTVIEKIKQAQKSIKT